MSYSLVRLKRRKLNILSNNVNTVIAKDVAYMK